MATAQTSTSKSASSSGVTKSGRASARPDDAVSLLMADHRKVEDLFKQYEKAKKDETKKQAIFQQISTELKVHTQIEEEIFYPASREFVDDAEMVNEAEVEHASAKDLIAQLDGMAPSDPYYDAKVKVLQEMIEHHVEEEETEYFPECRESDMDLKAIGEQLEARKLELAGKTR
ncbi:MULTISPECIES: hemerythrin domain-containing protein [unclassified Phenylobacterium]|jgi:hypothetical protein|uniref:hemerythrin domain-containing protein n=1 Tax=unclassified Phenylobacterium TaxID=2640670 RepID=UPI00083B115C|nr:MULTISPECIES: hemerythrin domain-containing protein [unclassified Phenylobacterium]